MRAGARGGGVKPALWICGGRRARTGGMPGFLGRVSLRRNRRGGLAPTLRLADSQFIPGTSALRLELSHRSRKSISTKAPPSNVASKFQIQRDFENHNSREHHRGILSPSTFETKRVLQYRWIRQLQRLDRMHKEFPPQLTPIHQCTRNKRE